MTNTDVLLVNAPVKKMTGHAKLSPPLGLAYIGSFLIQAGYNVSGLDLNIVPMDMSKLRQALSDVSPRILALSTLTETHLSGLAIARLAKEIHPETKVVIGGPHASVLYEDVSREPGIDVVVRGEGERTMLEVTCSFMFPHPEDTAETINEQKKFMKELTAMGAIATLVMTTPFPGTFFYDHADELGIRISAKDWDQYDGKHLIIATKHLSEDRLQTLLNELVDYVGMQKKRMK